MNKRANSKPVPTDRSERAKTRPYAIHKENPAGSKMLRRFYKTHHGVRASAKEAVEWFSTFNP